jgi:hypothetical protein
MSRKIERIKEDETLAACICNECTEQGVSVRVHPDLHDNQYVIVNIDTFYNAQKLANTPPSADCLIFQECANEAFCLFIVELKSQKSAKSIDAEQIWAKFETSLNDFVSLRYKDYFVLPPHKYRHVRCYLQDKMSSSLRLETMMEKPIIFRYTYIGTAYQRRLLIERSVPNPLPKE